MAEIKIEQKKQIWPWLLAGFILALILVYLLVLRSNRNDAELLGSANEINAANEGSMLDVKENNSKVAAYINFIEISHEKMDLDHAYTNEALLKLIDATSAMALAVGFEVSTDLERVKAYANKITYAPLVDSHADNIRKADDILSQVLENLQMAKYPELAIESAELKLASESINPDVLTLDQKDEVKNFFSKAAILLQKMN
jgi:hypothetical protein